MEFIGWFGGATIVEIFFNNFLDAVPQWGALGGGMLLYGVVTGVRRLRRRELPPPPRQTRGLPKPVDPLFGRDEEVAEVTAQAGKHRMVLVRGMAGAGTSAVALAAGWDLVSGAEPRCDPEHQYYVDLRGQDRNRPESTRSVAERVLRALGRPLRAATNLETAAQEVAAALGDPGRLLLLLDNVSLWSQVSWLPQNMPKGTIIVAGALDEDVRYPSLGDVAIVQIDLLDTAAVVELLRSQASAERSDADPESLRELAGQFLGMPQVVIGVGRWLDENPKVPIAALVADLKRQGAHDLGLQRLFSMQMARMDAAVRRLLALLAHAPVAELGIDEIVALTGGPERDAGQAMEELCRYGLVEKVRESRFRVTASARPAVRRPDGREAKAWRRLAEHLADRAVFFAERLPDEDARDWFALEDRTLLQMLREYRPDRHGSGFPWPKALRPDLGDPLWRIADALDVWFTLEQRVEERQETALALSNAAKSLKDVAVHADAELRLCLIALMRSDHDAAEKHFREAERLLPDLESRPARMHHAEGLRLLARGDEYVTVESPMVRYGQALPGGDTVGHAIRKHNNAVLYLRWGQTFDFQGREEEARYLYEGAGHLLIRALGDAKAAGYAHFEAHVWNNLALVHWYQGQNDEALEGWAKAAELYERAGDELGRLRCQVHRAAALRRTHHEEAVELLCSALPRLPKTGIITALANLYLAWLDPASAPERRGAGLAALAPWDGISEPLQVTEIRRLLKELPSGP
ncbi:tetratricopeptide repeat protein [Streptosporangium sp. NPDC004379]|uniref:tetratricopeptide repeat protein n=1 Tax=Streptosporangium sp. NPDC004379 TaxID=3366189 RepID=UPI0036B0E214